MPTITVFITLLLFACDRVAVDGDAALTGADKTSQNAKTGRGAHQGAQIAVEGLETKLVVTVNVSADQTYLSFLITNAGHDTLRLEIGYPVSHVFLVVNPKGDHIWKSHGPNVRLAAIEITIPPHGIHRIETLWTHTDLAGKRVPSGEYYVRAVSLTGPPELSSPWEKLVIPGRS